jgi:hypothetical protein
VGIDLHATDRVDRDVMGVFAHDVDMGSMSRICSIGHTIIKRDATTPYDPDGAGTIQPRAFAVA